jgi:hypothetical protein
MEATSNPNQPFARSHIAVLPTRQVGQKTMSDKIYRHNDESKISFFKIRNCFNYITRKGTFASNRKTVEKNDYKLQEM